MPRSQPAARFGLCSLMLGVLALAAVLGAAPRPAAAQDTLRAAIIVNDEAISELELVMRLRLALISSGLRETPETVERLRPQVIRTLIDELLQRQEARRLGITVDEQQVRDTFARIAQNNGLTGEQLADALRGAGVLPAYLADQIRAQLTWQAVVQRRLRPQVEVSQEEIDEAVARLEATKDQPQRLLAEIFLAVDNVTQEEEVRRQAQELRDEIAGGANFQAVARQFSQSASAANGGDLGWVEPGQLPQDLDQALQSLKPGDLSQPIDTLSGFYIILVRDERTAPENVVTVTLKQVAFPYKERTRNEVERAAGKAAQAAAAITGCADVEAVAERLGASGPTDLGATNLQDLAPNMQAAVSQLAIGQASPPVEIQGAIATVVLCDRQDGGINRGRVEERLVNEKLENLARRFMRDLRRAANVEIRV